MQMKPPMMATIAHMSIDSPSTSICAPPSTGIVNSVHNNSSVCPTESRMTGYFRWRMLSTTIRTIKNSSPMVIRWSMASVST